MPINLELEGEYAINPSLYGGLLPSLPSVAFPALRCLPSPPLPFPALACSAPLPCTFVRETAGEGGQERG